MKISYKKIRCNMHWGEPWSLYYSDQELNQYNIQAILVQGYYHRLELKKQCYVYVEMDGRREYICRDTDGAVQFYPFRVEAEIFPYDVACQIINDVYAIVSEYSGNKCVGLEVFNGTSERDTGPARH